jgi:hypothetical protein
MERIITVTLHKDNIGQYSLSLSSLTTLISVEDEDGNPINIRWVLLEDPTNPDFPNARKLTASFDVIPTPFTIASGPLPPTEDYITAGYGAGADVATGNVQDQSVGQSENATRLYKYKVIVETNDNQQIVLDPHVRVNRRKVTRGTVMGY